MPRERQKELPRRRQQRKRLKKLKQKLAQTKVIAKREHLIELIRRREPFYIPMDKQRNPKNLQT